MHVFEVTTEISALGESFLTERAFKRAKACVLSKVISKVAALFKDTAAVGISALEVELDPLGLRVFYSDSLMPLLGNSVESFVLISS